MDNDIAKNIDLIRSIWQAMLDEPQDPADAERIKRDGKRSSDPSKDQ